MKRASLLALLVLGCGENAAVTPQETRAASPARVQARVGGEVVSTVDGEPITLAQVRETAARLHLTPLDALRRLQAELAIVHRAETTPLVEDAEVRAAARRAAVRALLRTRVEAPHTAATQTSEAVAARHTEIAERLVQPEHRRATHVLVPIERDAEPARRDAARRIAERLLAEVALAPDALPAMDAAAGTHGAFDVVVEHLPSFPRDGLEASFAEALFTQRQPGLHPRIVETSFGFHLLYLEEVVPPWEVPQEEWEPAVRRQLSVEARAESLVALTDELGARQQVLLHPYLDEIFMQWPSEGP